ncbi:hypothetical protein V501_06943 [Pseudogymnoascus sp. VKM F-4519 (FW-2642)]|nr:hypothetical protein V501_06943 [Pseudogymnoascus sp. VKM F-4519 (FW-2642)]
MRGSGDSRGGVLKRGAYWAREGDGSLPTCGRPRQITGMVPTKDGGAAMAVATPPSILRTLTPLKTPSTLPPQTPKTTALIQLSESVSGLCDANPYYLINFMTKNEFGTADTASKEASRKKEGPRWCMLRSWYDDGINEGLFQLLSNSTFIVSETSSPLPYLAAGREFVEAPFPRFPLSYIGVLGQVNEGSHSQPSAAHCFIMLFFTFYIVPKEAATFFTTRAGKEGAPLVVMRFAKEGAALSAMRVTQEGATFSTMRFAKEGATPHFEEGAALKTRRFTKEGTTFKTTKFAKEGATFSIAKFAKEGAAPSTTRYERKVRLSRQREPAPETISLCFQFLILAVGLDDQTWVATRALKIGADELGE